MKLIVGQPAPQFEAIASDGRTIRLADYRDKKNLVLFFYPKDFTTVCTAEVCGFRDLYSDFLCKDVEVIGVSTDPDDTHRKFTETHAIPYPLIADTDKSLSRKYGASNFFLSLLGASKRVTFVIDKRGVVAGSFEAFTSAEPHLEGVKRVLEKLEADRTSLTGEVT